MLPLAGIIILGIFAQWIAWRTKVPAILPLLLIGLAVGPLSTLITEDGGKLIEPIYNEATHHGLFPGRSLFYFVSLAIGIILFEGGLTLKRAEIKDVGPAIGKLVSLGSLITFIGAGLAAYFIMNLPLSIAMLFGALIIVTGPTVIAPILQNIPLNRNVSTILKWEGILIDPVGALTAVLVFEFIRQGGGMGFTGHAVLEFAKIAAIGFALGYGAALALATLIKTDMIPHYLLNVFTLASVLAVFVFSDLLAHESGLLSVVVFGMALGNMDVDKLQEILDFKESLSVLLISILFILLSANINMSELELLLNWRTLVLFLVVVFVLRPLAVFASTGGLTTNEKLFISWVGPRGIVAAGIASLFGLSLAEDGIPGAEYITPLVFMIVLGTVLLNATTARLVAKLLKVIQTESTGILIIGANKTARVIGKFLKDSGRHVVMVDSNASNVKAAKELGIQGIRANIFTEELADKFELLDMGYMFALTSNTDVNKYAMERYKKNFGENGSFRLLSQEEMRIDRDKLPDTGYFNYTDDFINLSEVVRDHPTIHEVPVSSEDELRQWLKFLSEQKKSIPIFIRRADGFLHSIGKDLTALIIGEGTHLVYIGQKVDNFHYETPVDEETLEAEAEAVPSGDAPIAPRNRPDGPDE